MKCKYKQIFANRTTFRKTDCWIAIKKFATIKNIPDVKIGKTNGKINGVTFY